MMDDVLGYSSQTGYCFDNEKMIRDEREGGEYGGGEERKEMGRKGERERRERDGGGREREGGERERERKRHREMEGGREGEREGEMILGIKHL